MRDILHVFKNNKKNAFKFALETCHLHLIHRLSFFFFFGFINLFIAIFIVVDFLLTKSVKVQTSVTALRNLPVITIKHNNNGTVSTVATAESVIGEKSKLSTDAIS